MGTKIANEKKINCFIGGLFRKQIPATPAIQKTKNTKMKNETKRDPVKPKIL
jgi:hypothetical protein